MGPTARFHRYSTRALLAGAMLGAAIMFGPGAALADGSRLESNSSGAQQQVPACPDFGSFAIVDAPKAPGTRRGQPLVAQSYNNCADLPSTKPRVPIDIQVEVFPGQNQIGNQGQGTGQMLQQNRPQFPGSSFGPLRR